MKFLRLPARVLGPGLLAALPGLGLAAQSTPQPSLEEPLALAPPASRSERPWSVTAFLGQADDKRFHEIVRFQGGDMLDSYIAGAALNRYMFTTGKHLDWEVESSAYGHWGIEDHFEVNAALLARWTYLPWDQLIDTSIAFGQGMSWASEEPILESEPSRRFLHHMIAEVEVTPVPQSALSLVFRIHHRSGVFGLYGVSGGGNYLTLGLRYRF